MHLVALCGHLHCSSCASADAGSNSCTFSTTGNRTNHGA
jgi:hypothetical protein